TTAALPEPAVLPAADDRQYRGVLFATAARSQPARNPANPRSGDNCTGGAGVFRCGVSDPVVYRRISGAFWRLIRPTSAMPSSLAMYIPTRPFSNVSPTTWVRC